MVPVFLHLLIILSKGYFLSAEFTLYPYLISRGLLPYRDIIDQHFPSIFFGPFALPNFLVNSPVKLLFLFLSVLAATDLLLYRFLVKTKVPFPQLLLLLFVLISVYFSGNILWIEVFVNLFILIWLELNHHQKPWARLISGFLLVQILLLRPTFGPSLVLLFLVFEKINFYHILGGILGLLLPSIYLHLNHLWTDFYNLTFVFNSQVYPLGAKLLPGLRESVTVSLLLLSGILTSKNSLLKLSLILSLVLAYPRFGLEHLQPFVLIFVMMISEIKHKQVLVILVFAFALLNFVSALRHRYGNYFYPPELYQISEKIKSLPGTEIYLFGASDLIYSISGKLPPEGFYLPSLPWYLNHIPFQARIIDNLKSSKSPVLVDNHFTVDNQLLIDSSPTIIKFVLDNYQETRNLGRYTLYLP